ncbi:hypothetical protein IGI04_025518, partial [Brassica rapa subsp. trilocularis]
LLQYLAHDNHKLPVCLFPYSLINFDWLETASWEGKDSVLQMIKQVANCLLSAKLCYELNLQVKQPQLVFNPPPAASHVQNPAEKAREFHLVLEKDQKPQAYLGEEDQLRPSSPLVCLGKLWSPSLSQYLIRTVHGYLRSWSDQLCGALLVPSYPFSLLVHSALFKRNSSIVQASFKTLPGDRVLHDDAVSDCSYRTFDNDGDANSLVSMPPRRALFGRRGGPNLPISVSSSSDSSPPSTPAPLPTPSFDATPSGSSFETDPSEGSYDQTPVHMPLSPDPYFMDIEVDVVHDSPVHGDHPAAPASPAAHFPPALAAPIPAAQPGPAPTDPAIIALLELMAEMPVVTSAQPVVPVNPPLPLPPAKRQATAGRAYALELPGPSGPPQGPISGKDSVLQMIKQVANCLLLAMLCYELNPQVKQPQLVFNPPPAASHVQNPAEKPREFHLVLEKDQKPQAYLGEEDQLRPSSPLVCLGKLWSPSLSQYLIRTLRCGALLVPSYPFSLLVHSALFKRNSSIVQASFKTLPGDRVLHDDAVSDCSYRTFDNDGDANSLVSVTLRRETLKSFGRKERPTSGSILLSLQRTF